MKKLFLLCALASLTAGCAAEYPSDNYYNNGNYWGDNARDEHWNRNDRYYRDRDRDDDGVRNRNDRYPNDSRRY